uniref:Uncharacterized protein n=1 Tax=Oryza brachyantha TaxID=4533 RepID=J3MWZ2_ORYBR
MNPDDIASTRVVHSPRSRDGNGAEFATKIKELGVAIRSELLSPASKNTGVVVNLSNIQWLVDERCVAPDE